MKELRGVKPTLNPDRDPLTKAPPVPAYFSKWARAEWKRVIPRLIEDRIITKADLGGVEEYCLMRGVVREIEVARAEAKSAIDPKLFGVQNRAAQTARQLASEFGLSPISRARFNRASDEDGDDDNPLSL